MARAAVALAALLCALAAASAAAASAASAPTAQLVIVGATGDLSKKYLWQSAFNIWSSTGGRLHVFAAARHGETPSIVSEIVHSNVSCISGSASAASAEACARSVDRFLQNHVSAFAVSGDEGWAALGAAMRAQEATVQRRVVHMAIPPRFYAEAAGQLARGLLGSSGSDTSAMTVEADGEARREAAVPTRILLDKPVGVDGEDAGRIFADIAAAWPGVEVRAIDHYLAKAAVNAILEFRELAGAQFRGLWHWYNLRKVEVQLEELADVESRVDFFEGVGILRDTFQNHMTEMVAAALAPLAPYPGGGARNVSDTPLLTTAGLSAENASELIRAPVAVEGPVEGPLQTSAERMAFLKALRPTQPYAEELVTTVWGQYAGYDAHLAAAGQGSGDAPLPNVVRSRTLTAARVPFKVSSVPPVAGSRSAAEEAVAGLLGVPVVFAGGKALAARRGLIRLDFSPHGRLTFLLHGSIPVAVARADMGGLPEWVDADVDPENREQVRAVREKRKLREDSTVVRVDGPAIILERSEINGHMVPLPEALPAGFDVVVGRGGGRAPALIAVMRSHAQLLEGSADLRQAAFAAVADRHLRLPRSDDAYTAVLAGALAGNDLGTVPEAEVAELWGVWTPVLADLEADRARPVVVYPRGVREWMALYDAHGSAACDDATCGVALRSIMAGVSGLRDSEASLSVRMRSMTDPVAQDVARTLLVQRQRQRRKALKRVGGFALEFPRAQCITLAEQPQDGAPAAAAGEADDTLVVVPCEVAWKLPHAPRGTTRALGSLAERRRKRKATAKAAAGAEAPGKGE